MQGQFDIKALVHNALRQQPLMTFHTDILFETVSQLGEGGMGTVYRIRDRRLDREAALKVLKAGQSDQDSYVRFLREARITARLSHPAIPPVYEAGITPEGFPYLLMKLIKGRTLSDEIRELHGNDGLNRKSVRPFIEALIRVGEAISYAHSEGVIHRDLKPENIMMGDFGEVLVMDWGLAKEKEENEDETALKQMNQIPPSQIQSGMTIAGYVLGTPGYMSPEQARGEEVDRRADVFALGGILCEILTGRVPVEDTTPFKILLKTSQGEICTPAHYQFTDLPELAAISAAALHPDVKARPQSVSEFVEWLRCYQDNVPVPVYEYSFSQRLLRGIQRRPALVVGFVSILFFLLFASVLGLELVRANNRAENIEKQAVTVKNELKQSDKDKKDIEKKANLAAEKLKALSRLRSLLGRRRYGAEFLEELNFALQLDLKDSSYRLQLAEYCFRAEHVGKSRELALEIMSKESPAYDALFLLYQLASKTTEKSETDNPGYWLKEIRRRAELRGTEKNAYVLYAQATEAYEKEEWQRALDLYSEIENYTTAISTVYINRGSMKVRLKDLEGALEDFDRAIKLKPSEATAYFNKANVLRRMKRWSEALRDYSQCIAIDPEYLKVYTNRGAVFMKMGRAKEALADYGRAIKLNPKSVLAYSNRGNVYVSLQDWELALADYNSALQNDPQYQEGYLRRGVVRSRLGMDGVIEDYERFLEINPKHPYAPQARQLLKRARLQKRK